MSRKSFIPLWGDLKQTIDSYASSIRGLAMDVIQNSMDANREYNNKTKNNKPLKMRISVENNCLIIQDFNTTGLIGDKEKGLKSIDEGIPPEEDNHLVRSVQWKTPKQGSDNLGSRGIGTGTAMFQSLQLEAQVTEGQPNPQIQKRLAYMADSLTFEGDYKVVVLCSNPESQFEIFEDQEAIDLITNDEYIMETNTKMSDYKFNLKHLKPIKEKGSTRFIIHLPESNFYNDFDENTLGEDVFDDALEMIKDDFNGDLPSKNLYKSFINGDLEHAIQEIWAKPLLEGALEIAIVDFKGKENIVGPPPYLPSHKEIVTADESFDTDQKKIRKYSDIEIGLKDNQIIKELVIIFDENEDFSKYDREELMRGDAEYSINGIKLIRGNQTIRTDTASGPAVGDPFKRADIPFKSKHLTGYVCFSPNLDKALRKIEFVSHEGFKFKNPYIAIRKSIEKYVEKFIEETGIGSQANIEEIDIDSNFNEIANKLLGNSGGKKENINFNIYIDPLKEIYENGDSIVVKSKFLIPETSEYIEKNASVTVAVTDSDGEKILKKKKIEITNSKKAISPSITLDKTQLNPGKIKINVTFKIDDDKNTLVNKSKVIFFIKKPPVPPTPKPPIGVKLDWINLSEPGKDYVDNGDKVKIIFTVVNRTDKYPKVFSKLNCNEILIDETNVKLNDNSLSEEEYTYELIFGINKKTSQGDEELKLNDGINKISLELFNSNKIDADVVTKKPVTQVIHLGPPESGRGDGAGGDVFIPRNIDRGIDDKNGLNYRSHSENYEYPIILDIHLETENYQKNVNNEFLKNMNISLDERYHAAAGCEAWVNHIIESYIATNNESVIENVKNNLIGQKHLEAFKDDLDNLFELIQIDERNYDIVQISEKKRSVRDRLLEYFLNNGID